MCDGSLTDREHCTGAASCGMFHSDHMLWFVFYLFPYYLLVYMGNITDVVFSTGPPRKPRTRSVRTPRTKPSSSPTTPSRTSGWRTWVARRAASGPTCTRTRARRTTAADTTATTSVRRTAKCTGLHRTGPDSTGLDRTPPDWTGLDRTPVPSDLDDTARRRTRARTYARTNERTND